jgi:hypothetical protein
VATYSTGISVSWDGDPFGEVQELTWNFGGTRTGRDTAFLADQGTITVTCLTPDSRTTDIAQFGTRKQLVISGGGAGLTTYAIWESVTVLPQRNGVTQYTVTFRIIDS